MEQKAHLDLGHLEQESAKYAVHGATSAEIRNDRGTQCSFVPRTLGTKISDGPEIGTTSGISADRGTRDARFVPGT
ncbi:hypothetical protein KI387_011558, partial [Taxus chinensis]